MENFNDIFISYGQSDEYSFVLKKNSTLFGRRSDKINSCVVSCFSSAFTFYFKEFFGNNDFDIPMFDSRCVCYPSYEDMRNYLSWRQVDCHINN